MNPEEQTPEQAKNKQRISLSLDLRLVVGLLLVVIGVLVWLWSPWTAPATDGRTISVSGDATITAEPDQYVFNPSYSFVNADKAAALKELTAKSDDVTAKLKALGVADSQIKSDSSGYNYSYDDTNNNYTYTLGYTVTLTDKKLVQKVQDYLVTTAPSGAVSPYASFSTAKQKVLQVQARDAATKEARTKADQSAKNLGFKVSKVKSVNDAGFDGGIQPYVTMGGAMDVTSGTERSLKVQPGQNDLNYTVTVVYYIR